MSPPRVVFVDFLAAVAAGQLTRARAFMRRVYEIDADSHFVILRERGTLEDVVKPGPRTTVIDVALSQGPFKGVRRILWESRYVAGLIARHRADVYLTFSHFLPRGVRTAVRIVGVSNLAPFSQEAIEADAFPGRLRLHLLRWLIVNSVRRATHVIALSVACKDSLVGAGVDPERILVLTNGCDDFVEALALPDAAVQGQVAPPPYVLCVSHFYAYKNFEVLLDGFARLAPHLRERHTLVLVGAPIDRKYFERVSARSASLAERCRIVILPGVPYTDLPALYRNASAFVFTSLVENSPNALLEAMSAGLPMAVVDREPMPEFAGDAALYFAPHSSNELAAAMSRLLEDGELRQRLSERARMRSARYRWDVLVRGTVAAYNPAVNEPGRTTAI